MNKLLTSQKGWIFLDSIIGMIILSIAIIALVFGSTQATKSTVASTNRTQATYFAQQALEQLKAQDGNETIDKTVIKSPVTAGNKVVYTVLPAELSVPEIINDKDGLTNNLKPYKITVTWSDASGGKAEKSLTMVGYCYVVLPEK